MMHTLLLNKFHMQHRIYSLLVLDFKPKCVNINTFVILFELNLTVFILWFGSFTQVSEQLVDMSKPSVSPGPEMHVLSVLLLCLTYFLCLLIQHSHFNRVRLFFIFFRTFIFIYLLRTSSSSFP